MVNQVTSGHCPWEAKLLIGAAGGHRATKSYRKVVELGKIANQPHLWPEDVGRIGVWQEGACFGMGYTASPQFCLPKQAGGKGRLRVQDQAFSTERGLRESIYALGTNFLGVRELKPTLSFCT